MKASDYEKVTSNIQQAGTKKSRGAYKSYSAKDRFLIGKHASIYGTASAIRKWKKDHPQLNESTIRNFKKRYENQINEEKRRKKSPKKVIVNKLRGRPCLLGDKIDPLVKNYLKARRYKGGVVNTTVAIATAKALIDQYPLLEKGHLEFGRTWAQSLFRRLGFVRRMKTTGKVRIPLGAQREAELRFLHQIVNHVETHKIPHSLIINFDQTPSKYVQVSAMTMDKKGASNVPIEGIDDKRSITATFSVTLDNKFLPMQLIYKGKTNQSLPKVKFPNRFSLSANKSHYSNETESIKFLEEIILPYIRQERERLGCENQKALLIFDVFRGQTTNRVVELLEENHILATKVPPNMTNLYQPLDLSVNKAAKDFTRKKFSEWYTRQLTNGIKNGLELDDIDIDYRLSVLKPLHATWLISLYDHMNTEEGMKVTASGWKKSGIFDAITKGSSELPSLDPFDDICPLMEVIQEQETISLSSLMPSELEFYKTSPAEVEDSSDESEWEVNDNAEPDENDIELDVERNNAFSIFENQ